MDPARADLGIAPKALSKHPNDLARNVAGGAIVPDERSGNNSMMPPLRSTPSSRCTTKIS